MKLRAVVAVLALAAVAQTDVIRSHFAESAGTAERPAVSIAWIQNGRTEFVNFGRKTLPDGASPASDTLYEIGSITKTFTGTLLADMVLNKEVRLESTIGELVPEKNYSAHARRITLLALATHSSGLPRLPDNMAAAAAKDPMNPYAYYSTDDLDAYLRTYTAASAKPQPLYSNLGVGLLGNVLAAKAGKRYEQLITERVLAPLGMRETSITLTAAQKARLAPGHAGGRIVPNWDIPAFAGAGALRSTAADMAKYLSAVLDPPDSRIGRAIRIAREPRADFANGMRIGLAWITRKSDAGKDLTWHNGGTGGYRTFIGVIPDAKVGLVVLTNATSNPDPLAVQTLNALANR
jgi:CubicO group peptidase (beta-lactamase class C family)